MQKSIQLLIFSFIVVFILSTSLFVFFNVYEEYEMAKSNSAKVDSHYQKLLVKKQQLEKVKSYASLASKVNNAIEKLNYTSDKWTHYEVSLDKGLKFSELNYILNQTQHGKDYFFIPKKLEVNLPDKSTVPNEKNIDAHLKLEGRYLVRQW